jgi:hypothetical protein
MISAKRNADSAERKTTKCSIRCKRYADADNESRANESKESLHFSIEIDISDHR